MLLPAAEAGWKISRWSPDQHATLVDPTQCSQFDSVLATYSSGGRWLNCIVGVTASTGAMMGRQPVTENMEKKVLNRELKTQLVAGIVAAIVGGVIAALMSFWIFELQKTKDNAERLLEAFSRVSILQMQRELAFTAILSGHHAAWEIAHRAGDRAGEHAHDLVSLLNCYYRVHWNTVDEECQQLLRSLDADFGASTQSYKDYVAGNVEVFSAQFKGSLRLRYDLVHANLEAAIHKQVGSVDLQ